METLKKLRSKYEKNNNLSLKDIKELSKYANPVDKQLFDMGLDDYL